jgi:uncharacterized protein (TIRG00374 family)
MKSKFIKIVVAVFLFLLWLKLVNVGELLQEFTKVNWLWFFPLIVTSLVIMALSALRLRALLDSSFSCSFLYCLKLNLVGMVASLITPAQGGGFLRAYLIKKKYASSFSRAFGLILLDFLFGLGTIFLLALLGFAFFALKGDGAVIQKGFVLLVFLLSVGGLVVILKPDWVRRISFLVIGLIPSSQVQKRFIRALEEFWEAFFLISSQTGLLIFVFLLSVLVMGLSGISVYFIFRSFGTVVSPVEVIFATAVAGAVNSVPIAPAKIGQQELVGLVVFSRLMGIQRSLAGGAVFLGHIYDITFTLLISGLVFVLLTKDGEFEELRSISNLPFKIRGR